MYQQEVQQFPPGHCPVPGGPGLGPGPSPGAVLGDFFPETDRPQTRTHVIKATPRTRPRSSRRSETESRYAWCQVPYQQPQVRPNTGGSSQPLMMPPRGPVNQHLVRQRPIDASSNTMLAWQERPGPPAMPPPPPPPPRPSPYPSAERPYEYTQPPPNIGGGESFPAMHSHMPPAQQMIPQQYQNMPPMQQGATPYEYHGPADCAWRQMPMCHSAPRPPFPQPQYATPPQQARQYYHQNHNQPRQGGMPNVQYAPQYQQNTEVPGTWAPPPPPPPPPSGHNRQPRYVTSQQQPQVMTLPPMTTPPPGHYYVMERPPSQPLVKIYDVPEKDNANVPPAYYNTQRNNMQASSQQQRVYGQQQCGRYSQAVGQPVNSSKPRNQHPPKQYTENQKAYNQIIHQDMAQMAQAQQAPGRQYATYNSSSEQLVTNESNPNLQQYPYFYRYSETVKTSQPLTDHCDMNAGGQNLNTRSCSDHSLPVVSHQTKSTIISSKSVSEVQMLVGVAGGNPGNDYRLTANMDHPTETPNTCSRVETATPKLAVRSGNKHHNTTLMKQCNNPTKKQSARNDACGNAKDKSSKVSKRSGSNMADTRCSHSSSRSSCKRRLSDSSEVSTMTDRGRVYSQGNEAGCWQQVSQNDTKPVPKLDLGNLALCDDESDFEDVPETNYKCQPQTLSTPKINSNGDCAFLEAINKDPKVHGTKVSESTPKNNASYDPFNPSSAASFEYSIDAERLVARLCYSSPETSPPSSAQMHLGCNPHAEGMSNRHNCLIPGSSLSNMYTSLEKNQENGHIRSEIHNHDLKLININNILNSDCDSHSNSTVNTVTCENNGSHSTLAVNDSVISNDSVWKEGVVLISKGLALLKTCRTKDTELVKRFESMVYDLETKSRLGYVGDSQNSFSSLGQHSSPRRHYSSRLSYVDQLYEYKSKMVASEGASDLFEIFQPVVTDLPRVQDFNNCELINDDSKLLDGAYSLAKGKTVITTPVQSQEINWGQYEDVGCQGDVDTNILCEQDAVANNTEGSKWEQAPSSRYPYTEQSFTISKQMTDQHSVRRDFTPNSPYESYPSNNDGGIVPHTPWSAKLWDSYPNVGTVEEMYQQTLFYQQNEFDHLMHGQIGFNSGQQHELGLLSRNENKDNVSQSPFQVNSSNPTKEQLSCSHKNSSNCEQDIHFLQSAASKVAPGRCVKKGGTSSVSASAAKSRRRTIGQTPCASDVEGTNFNTPTCGLIDTESDDNISYYMKPGNYLVPKKPMSARLRTEKKVISRNRRKAFSAPAKTSIFIPYPLDPVVPPLPQLPQNPTPLFGDGDVPVPHDMSRLQATSVKGMNDPEHFSNSSHPSFIPLSKHAKENKKNDSPVTSTNSKDRKKKDNPRSQYPKVAPKEVRQFQILRRVSKINGKVDTSKSTLADSPKVTGLNVVNQSKSVNSQTCPTNGSDTSLKSNSINENKEFVAEIVPNVLDQTISSLQNLSINDNSGQQRGRKNAAMKSILNFKVKCKPCDKVNILDNKLIPGKVLSDLDSVDTCTSEVTNAERPCSSQSTVHDTTEQNLDRKSVSDCSMTESKTPLQNGSNENENKAGLSHSKARHYLSGFKNVDRKFDNCDKVLPGEPARASPPQRLSDNNRSDNIFTAAKHPGTVAPSLQCLGNPAPLNVNRGTHVGAKGVYPLKGHTSAPNISLERAMSGPSKAKFPTGTALNEPPISRQFTEAREKLERLNAQKNSGHVKTTNAGSDDSSSTTTSMSSRHRRGPTPIALGKFEKILRNVCSMPESQFVKHNVSSNQLREYYQIVKYPIFLENIENKLKNRYYMTIEDIVHDFRQILFNSRLYFKDSPVVLKKTETLEGRLNELLNEYFSGWDFRQITGDPGERLRNRR